jgi:hypothetical protein
VWIFSTLPNWNHIKKAKASNAKARVKMEKTLLMLSRLRNNQVIIASRAHRIPEISIGMA